MPFSFRRLRQAHFLALGVIALLGMTALAVTKLGWFNQARTPASIAPQPITARNGEATGDPQGVIQLLLRPEGFDSKTLTVANGRYVLILLNRTGLENLGLQVSRVVGNGEKPKDIPFDAKKKYRIDSLIDLTPGDYVVTVQAHPEWVCRISTVNK